MPHPVGYLLRAVAGMPAKARRGLYAGKRVGVVNRVSSEYEVRSKKLCKPNVVKKRLWSQALGEKVQLHVTTTALRRIDRAGGLDRYLLKTPDSLLHSDVGSDLKFRIGLIYRHKQHQQALEQRRRQQQQQLGGGGGSRGGGSSLLPRAAAAALAPTGQR